jgi:hypothetical protein
VKAIGIIVLLLVIGLGVVTFVVTKEPDRDLDPQGRSWVADYDAWSGTLARQVTVAQRGVSLTTPAKNARLLEPLRACGGSLTRIGEPPEVLVDVHEAAQRACGEALFALAKNDEFGVSALATTRVHLGEVEEQLGVAQHNLEVALDEPQ